MPTGLKPKGRPADVASNAVHVMKVLTGETEDFPADDGKDKAAQSLGRRGGRARAQKLSAAERSAIARKAAAARYAKP